MSVLPRAILFDLDDTLIRAYAQPEDAWRRLLAVFAAHLDAPDAAAIERVRVAVMEEARAFWSDSDAAAKWRLDVPGARRLSVRQGLAKLGQTDEALADRIADAFTKMRRDEYKLYPDAHDAAAIEGVRVAVMEEARAFWSDSEAAAKWRLDVPGARRLSVRRGLAKLGQTDEALADRIADAFTKMRRDEYKLYPDAHATVDALRQAGVKLALVTNGAAETQREKIVRFELAHRFDHIQIEGEFGQGKPELAVYRHALERLEVDAGDAWMVGDNYEWEVVAPQRLGMCGIWYDPFEAGVPAHATARPTRIIRRLAELVE